MTHPNTPQPDTPSAPQAERLSDERIEDLERRASEEWRRGEGVDFLLAMQQLRALRAALAGLDLCRYGASCQRPAAPDSFLCEEHRA